ncbi:MAG TPA: hypothetical protein VH575_14465 [Gemmataceae bacterium]|jgi:hypothetical protein
MRPRDLGDTMALHFVGGRRAYNNRRKMLAMVRRRYQLPPLLDIHGWPSCRGAMTRIAKDLGVSRRTARRDVLLFHRELADARQREAASRKPDILGEVWEQMKADGDLEESGGNV